MNQSISKEIANSTLPIEKLASLIRSFSREQKALLVQLVPELQTIRPDEPEIPSAQRELIGYFQKQLNALPNVRPMQDDDAFLEGFTVSQFFALPEGEQTLLWQEAHQAAERELSQLERPVRPDALPTR